MTNQVATATPIQQQKPFLNAGQQIAADGFFEFLFSKENELILSGPGGYGKTFLMGYLIDEVMPRYHASCKLLGIDPLYHNVVMTATTNKAASVLGDATHRPTQTTHSFLNLKVMDDFDTGISKLIKTRNWTVHQGIIAFVDEYTMLGFKARQFLKEGTHNCKIIYVGDHCQLEPVKDDMSPGEHEKLPFFELTQPMRNADQPALMTLCNQLRETVKTDVFRPIKVVPGVIDLLDGPQMEREIELHFTDPSNHDRILAYTNNRVIAYNDHIRDMRGLPSTFTVGEHVISNSAMQFPMPGTNLVQVMSVEDEFEVTDVSPSIHTVVIEPNATFDCMFVTLKGVYGNQGIFKNVPIPVNKEHFTALIKYYAKKKDWKHYYKLKNEYPDLRPRDATTVHKAQGSTHDTVFIDMDDLSTCKDRDTTARLLYVWATRARKRLVMYGTLAKKYGGIIT